MAIWEQRTSMSGFWNSHRLDVEGRDGNSWSIHSALCVAGYGQTGPEFMALGVLTWIRTGHSFSFGICLVTGGGGNQSSHHRVTPLWQFNIAIETGQLGVDLPSGNQTWQWKIHYLQLIFLLKPTFRWWIPVATFDYWRVPSSKLTVCYWKWPLK